MSCPIVLNGIAYVCKGRGGVVRIFVADRSLLKTELSVTQDVIDDIFELEGTFVEYKVKRSENGLTTSAVLENNTLHYNSELTLNLHRMSKELNAEFHSLATGDLAIVVEDNNGERWFLGKDFPVEMSSGTFTTGVELSDKNGYELTLTDVSYLPPFKISPSIDLVPTV